MPELPESHHSRVPPAGDSHVGQTDDREPPAGVRARATWVALLLVVLLGAALFLRFGDSILPLIREAS
ncbi:MAG TPA: hypothetical protein VKZ41_12470 [Gemmatimonadales bacterium]|nr:hypothetical protein [Gemmatimonadales bacterium]